MVQSDALELSNSTLAVLAVSGVSLLYIALYVLRAVLKGVAALSTRRPARTPSSLKTSKPAKQPPQQRIAEVQAPSTPERQRPDASTSAKERGPDLKSLIKQAKKESHKKTSGKDDHSHALFLNTLKGHGDVVASLAWSADGRALATACDDMQVRIFDMTHGPDNKDLKFRFLRVPFPPLDVGFGNDLTQVVTVLRGIPDVAIVGMYGLQQQQQQSQQPHTTPSWQLLWEKQAAHGREAAVAMVAVPASASPGRLGVVVSLSSKKEGHVYSMSGAELGTFEPNSLGNHDLAVAADGRFVAVASFTADVKIWELASKGGEFRGAVKAMDLKGHKSQVMCVALSPDGTRAVTASKDGTLRVWRLDVRYHMNEDPKTLLVRNLPLPAGKCYQRMAFGPDGTIAAAHGGAIHFIASETGDLLESIEAHDASITRLHWAPKLVALHGSTSPVAVLASSSTDRRVRLWRSPKDVGDER